MSNTQTIPQTDEMVMTQPEIRESLRTFIRVQAAMRDITIGEYITGVFLAHTDYELPTLVRKPGGTSAKEPGNRAQ